MYKIFKRIIDFFASLLILLILFPVLLIITLLLLFSLKGNPFFIQPRPGKDEKIFKIVKFKTMNNKKDSNGVLLPDNERITKIGRFLRKYSLDELPQFINVLKGDMSMVGPRPLLVKYLPNYTPHQRRRHEVKPGITGLAQIKGRNKLNWGDRFDLDVYYIDNYNLFLDLKILLATLLKVFKSEGINISENTTMHPFEGNKNK